MNKGVATKALIDNWSERILSYKEKNGDYPSKEGGLLSLCDEQKFDCLEKPTDVWHNDLNYIYPSEFGSKEFDLYSFGKNGIDDYGEGDDISNWTSLSTVHYYPARWIFAVIILIITATSMLYLFSKLRHKIREHRGRGRS
jgi:hypothetical protein